MSWGRAVKAASEATGSEWAFGAAVAMVVAWAALGPLMGFSDTWQLLINTPTTVLTFLMVFLLQGAQDRDDKAVHRELAEIRQALARLEAPPPRCDSCGHYLVDHCRLHSPACCPEWCPDGDPADDLADDPDPDELASVLDALDE